jgi:hypothetical protein
VKFLLVRYFAELYYDVCTIILDFIKCLDALMARAVPHALVRAICTCINTKVVACLDVSDQASLLRRRMPKHACLWIFSEYIWWIYLANIYIHMYIYINKPCLIKVFITNETKSYIYIYIYTGCPPKKCSSLIRNNF